MDSGMPSGITIDAGHGTNPTIWFDDVKVSTQLPPLIVGTAYSFTPTATNAASFGIMGSIPPGLNFDTTTGTLSGTLTTVGTYSNIVITATNASGSSVSLPAFTITVNPPLPTISGTPSITATVGTAYSFTPSSTNAVSFGIKGSIPPGLTFNSITGSLSGTPTTAGTYNNIQIIVANVSGWASLPAFTITVITGAAQGSLGAVHETKKNVR